jgi:hypothetical protein
MEKSTGKWGKMGERNRNRKGIELFGNGLFGKEVTILAPFFAQRFWKNF